MDKYRMPTLQYDMDLILHARVRFITIHLSVPSKSFHLFCRAKRKQNNYIFCKNDIFVSIGKISGFAPIFDVKISYFLYKNHLKMNFKIRKYVVSPVYLMFF
jgi:hypothetical protein